MENYFAICKAISALDGLDEGDPENAHGMADAILLTLLSDLGYDEVVEAYEAVIIRCSWWACA